MSYQTRLVRLVYTVVDTMEVVAIEPQGKKRKRTVVHLRGGQSLVVPLRVGEVHKTIWGGDTWSAEQEFEDGFRRPDGIFAYPTVDATEEDLEDAASSSGSVAWPEVDEQELSGLRMVVPPIERRVRVPFGISFDDDGPELCERGQPPAVRKVADRLRADPDELAKAEEDSASNIEFQQEQDHLYKKLDAISEDGSIGIALTPMFPQRQLVFSVIEVRYPENKYELQKLADNSWFAKLARLKEDDPESCSSISEARRIIEMKSLSGEQISWAVEKTKKALKDLDWFWDREVYEHTALFEQFLIEHEEKTDNDAVD